MTAPADTALELLEYIDRSGGEVWLEGVRLLYRLPLGDGHAAMLERLAATRDAVRAVLLARSPAPMLDQTQTSAATLEPLVWQAIRAAIPESLEIMGENKQVLAWLEYRSPSRGWVSSDPVSATRDQLEQLVQAVAALEPDALCVAIRGAVSLHPDVNPAWQGARQGVSQLARFSRRAINA